MREMKFMAGKAAREVDKYFWRIHAEMQKGGKEMFTERLKHDLEKLIPIIYGDPDGMDRNLVDRHPSAEDMMKLLRYSHEERLVVGFVDPPAARYRWTQAKGRWMALEEQSHDEAA
jgi:hypothetical protein